MISIITPVYNGEEHIEACLQNVIDQQCEDIEHLILDGRSSDQTAGIVKKYAEEYAHIRWFSEKDSGQSQAMNNGLEQAEGTIIGILNVDDYYEPGVLNRVKQLFHDKPDPCLLVGNCLIHNAEGETRCSKPAKMNLVNLLAGKVLAVNPSSYFYHKSLHDEMGLYDPQEHQVMDVDFLIRAVQYAHVEYVDEVWGNFSLRSGTKTYEAMQRGELRHQLNRLRDMHLRRVKLHQRLHVAFTVMMGRLKKQTRRQLRAAKRTLAVVASTR